MKKLFLSVHPKESVQKILKLLPNQRLREVLERRFGLKGKDPETLEAIGKSWEVTRERVRQIEADAMKRLSAPDVKSALEPIAKQLEEHFDRHGNVFEETKLLSSVAEPRFFNHVYFILTAAEPFKSKAEVSDWHDRWFTKDEALKAAETILTKTSDELASSKKPVDGRLLFKILKDKAREVLGSVPHPDVLESYLAISKHIRQNPYGEFGLVSWPAISPRGVRDKAYAALSKGGKPMHFREVAQAISRAGWSQKKAHPQTVHNELIKSSRFVLVGRGLYGLSEWGYEPGTVAEVITSILGQSRKPRKREEIVKQVLAKRFVKENTILLNLQNRQRFKRTPEGYSLV